MTERILGEAGPKRKRRFRFIFLPILLGAALALMMAGGAQAVHDEGVFELDGNALTANDCPAPTGTPPPAGCEPTNPFATLGGEDWDKVFGGTSSAEATSFVTDTTSIGGLAGAGDSILTGGSTKDINDLPSWLWKQTAVTSVQDKDDIEHAYAAQYKVDKSGTGQSCGSTGPTANCTLLYFGADRFSNSGDSVMGFWFFKAQVGTSALDAGGNGTFTGLHTAATATSRGDILVVSDFRAGGKAPSIQVYEWVTSGGSASTHLNQIGGSDNPASCTQAPPEKNNGTPIPPVSANDNFCATANQNVVTSPWAFTPKSNSGGTAGPDGGTAKFGVAEFMEGGINMTALGLGNTCFSTFMAETRAAHSVTSTLSDFALGTFGACTSGITTTPHTGAGTQLTTASIGTSARVAVKDHAVINVTGTTGSFGGTVKFFLCGPLAASTTTNCSTGGAQIGTPTAGETVSGSNGTATLDSDEATLTSAGRYCWRAEYSGDSSVGVPASKDPSKSVADGGTTSECFTITPVQPTLTTTAGADVTLGNTISDTASLTGTAKQPGTDGVGGLETIAPGSINATALTQADAGGSITFSVDGPDTCTASGLTVTGSPVTVSGDSTSYGPVTALPTALGTYTFIATYSGNSPNTLGAGPSACPNGDEEVTVTGVATLETAQRWLPNDTAHITGPSGTTLAGTVTFTLYNDGSCGNDGGTAQYGPINKDVVTDANSGGTANNRFVSTTNTAFFVTTANDAVAWSWKVSYNDTNLTDPADKCETTTPAFTLTDG
jgi:hypothetical protein